VLSNQRKADSDLVDYITLMKETVRYPETSISTTANQTEKLNVRKKSMPCCVQL